MDRRFRQKHDARNQGLFLEPLEGRSLLSGIPLLESGADEYTPSLDSPAPLVDAMPPTIDEFVPSSGELAPYVGDIVPPAVELPPHVDSAALLPPSESNVAVEVVELGIATPPSEIVQPIAESEIPQNVVDAVDAHLPGAVLVEAEVYAENGAAVYEVSTEFEGRPIDVTLANDGSILDTAYDVTPAELPQPVQDWVEENFPGSMIGSAQLVTQSDGVSYDLLIATGEGEFFEATLRLQSVKTPRSFLSHLENFGELTEYAAWSERDATSASETVADGTLHTEQTTSDVPLEPSSGETAAVDDPARSTCSSLAFEEGQPEAPQVKLVMAVGQPEQTSTSDELQLDAITSDNLAECLLPIAGAINDLLPINVAALEQGLLQLLDEVDGFLESVTQSTVANTVLTRGAIAAALVAGARVIVLESKRRRLDPILVSGAANSTWGWLLATTIPPPRV